MWLSKRCNKDIGPHAMGMEVACFAIAKRNSCTCGKHEHGLRFTNDVACTHNHCICAAQSDLAVFEHQHHASRRAGHQARLSRKERAAIDRVKAVDILIGVDPVDERCGVEMLGKRQL